MWKAWMLGLTIGLAAAMAWAQLPANAPPPSTFGPAGAPAGMPGQPPVQAGDTNCPNCSPSSLAPPQEPPPPGFMPPGWPAGMGGPAGPGDQPPPALAGMPIYSSSGSGNIYPATVPSAIDHGLADLLRSDGEREQRLADAAVRAGQADRLFLENRTLAIQNYFQAQDYNRAMRARERGPRLPPAAYAQIAHANAPRRLGPMELDPVSGRLNWPLLLRTEGGVAQRMALEQLFVQRAVNRGLTAEQYLEIDRITKIMLADLLSQVSVVPANMYIEAKRFLQSVAYEAMLPAG